MKLDDDGRDEMMAWLNTLSKPKQFIDDPKSAAMEIGMLEEALFRSGAKTPDKIRSVFHHIKNTATHRTWPIAADINRAAMELREKALSGRRDSDRGDRSKLSYDEIALLADVLSTAREWLTIPALKAHGVQTLEFWGENVPTQGG